MCIIYILAIPFLGICLKETFPATQGDLYEDVNSSVLFNRRKRKRKLSAQNIDKCCI